MAAKPDWLYRQSGVVPYQRLGHELHVVLITSSGSRQWVIPKGVVERHLSPAASAAKEAEEEAGVIGTLDETVICEYSYEKWGGVCHVQVFPLQVTTILPTWEEADLRERTIVPLPVAIDMVKPVLIDVLCRFREQMSAGGDLC